LHIKIGVFTLEIDHGLYIASPRFELLAGARQAQQPGQKFADCWTDEDPLCKSLYVLFGPWELTASLLLAAASRDAGDDAAAEAVQ
jgi:hypothetical protein